MSWAEYQQTGNDGLAGLCEPPEHELVQSRRLRRLYAVSREHIAPVPRPSLSRASTFPTPDGTRRDGRCSAGRHVSLQSTKATC